MQMRKYGKGWFNEPYRHGLAAKGIKTSFAKKFKQKEWPWSLPPGPARDKRIQELLEAEEKQKLFPPEPATFTSLGKPAGISGDEIKRILEKKELSRRDVSDIKWFFGPKAGDVLRAHKAYWRGGGRDQIVKDLMDELQQLAGEINTGGFDEKLMVFKQKVDQAAKKPGVDVSEIRSRIKELQEKRLKLLKDVGTRREIVGVLEREEEEL